MPTADKETEILGIYGGTFSPPHRGHRRAAKAFLSAIRPDKLLIIPTFLPPHKKISSADSPEHRLAMCRLCFGDLPKTEISDIEIERRGKSYTFDTLTALSAPGRALYFLCGTDMLLSFDRWYRFRDIFSLCTLVLERRETDPELGKEIEDKIAFYRKEYGARIVEISLSPLEISSTEVRNAERAGITHELLTAMVPEAVAEYIEKNRLYRN